MNIYEWLKSFFGNLAMAKVMIPVSKTEQKKKTGKHTNKEKITRLWK